ncbi:MAG: hypothetical protein GY754_30325 [bacterium]|nr:hypothetical protein [bacterium]
MFLTEKELVSAFNRLYTQFLKEILDSDPYHAFLINEYDSKNGIADIVLGTYNPLIKKEKKRMLIDLNWLGPLKKAKIGSIKTIKDFSGRHNISRKLASHCLNSYTEAGFFKRIDKSSFEKSKDYSVFLQEIISIEAKLKDWKSALRQAYRYKEFSNMSFVLLDENHSKKAVESPKEFKRYNIGLITMKDESYTIHYIPEKKELSDSTGFLKINETVYQKIILQGTQ